MFFRCGLAMVLPLLVLDLAALAQIGYPGGYPPGGYPPGRYPYPGGGGGVGIPSPRRGKKNKKQEEAAPLQSIRGKLKQVGTDSIELDSEDGRILTVKRTDKTKFLRNGDLIAASEFQAGDQVFIEANQDQDGYLYAVNVTLEKKAAREAKTTTQADSPKAAPADRAEKAERAEKESESREPATSAAPPPAPPDPDDTGPPQLRRGKPPRRETREVPEVAENRPPVVENKTADTSLRRSAESRENDSQAAAAPHDPRLAAIEKAREVAGSFIEGLPNYVCQEFMARFVSQTHKVDWQPLDVVSAEVVYENGRERYRNLAVNGKLTHKPMEEMSGSWSTGEFGTVLVDLFSTSTAADFRYRKDDTIAGFSAAVYDFSVDREHSHWKIQVASQAVFPAYDGSLWLDRKTFRVLRIEMQARRIPEEFPLDKVEMATDYDYVRFGTANQFLMPVHAETLSCQRGTSICSRNKIDFRNYHKYTGESSITFSKEKEKE